MTPRPIASATMSFGLVSIPCQLYSSAETSKKVRFNYLSPSGTRVKQQYVDALSGDPVERSDLIKGYQFAKAQYVTFTPDELKALEAVATQAIEIVEFVPVDQVERVYIGKTYFLGPGKGGDKAYRLLGSAMSQTNTAALAKYAARGKQYLVLVRPVGDRLVLEQLHYAHEVRDIGSVPAGDTEVSEAELTLAVQMIDQITSGAFDPSKYEDEVGTRVLAAIEKKIADGAEISAPVEEEPATQVIDLMEALKASIAKPGDAEAGGAGEATGGSEEEEPDVVPLRRQSAG